MKKFTRLNKIREVLNMTIEERAAKAADLKAAGACNCSQAVVKVFEDKLSLDDETLMKLTAGYAAGMGMSGSNLRGTHWSCDDCRSPDRRSRNASLFQRNPCKVSAKMRCNDLQGVEGRRHRKGTL